MNDLKAAIDGLEALKTHYDIQGPGAEAGTVYHLFVASIDTALSALREKQQRERGCEWCNGAWEKSDIDYISGVSEWDIDSMDFCPRCGRYLARNAEQEEGGE